MQSIEIALQLAVCSFCKFTHFIYTLETVGTRSSTTNFGSGPMSRTFLILDSAVDNVLTEIVVK